MQVEKKYVMGIDGGGTKSYCVIFDIEGKFIDVMKGGILGYEHLPGGYSSLEIKINEVIDDILKKNSIRKEEIASCVIGLSGIDTVFQKQEISKIINRIGFNKYILCNDAFLGIKTVSKKGYGICAVNGTGYSVVGIDPKNNTFQIGGSYELSGDFGGATVIGKVVAAKVYETLFKIERESILQKMMFDLLGIKSKYDYLDALIEKTESGELYIKDFNKLLFRAADYGDNLSCEILSKMGEDYGYAINAVIRELDYDKCYDIPVALIGSLFTRERNSLVIQKIIEIVEGFNRHKNITISALEHPPICGAIIWAFNSINKKDKFYEEIVFQLDWNRILNKIDF